MIMLSYLCASHTSFVSLPDIFLTFFSHSLHSLYILIPLPFSNFTFLTLVPSSCSLPLSFFLLLKLSSDSIEAFNRMYSLSRDTFAFSNRNLQLSVRLSAAREHCWRECPLNSHIYFNIRLRFKVRLCSSATLPCRSLTTLSSCRCRPSYPSVHVWMCYPAIWFLCLPEEVQL